MPPEYSLAALTCCFGCRPGAVMVGCWVRLKIACLLMRWLLELVVLMFSADRAKDNVPPEPRAPDGNASSESRGPN